MSRTYAVGYKKPPTATQFQKGQSGNPAGRKAGSTNLSAIIKAALQEKVVVNNGGKRSSITKLQAALLQLSTKAAGGDQKATKLVIELLVSSEAHERANQDRPEASPEERRALSQTVIAALQARLESEEDDG